MFHWLCLISDGVCVCEGVRVWDVCTDTNAPSSWSYYMAINISYQHGDYRVWVCVRTLMVFGWTFYNPQRTTIFVTHTHKHPFIHTCCVLQSYLCLTLARCKSVWLFKEACPPSVRRFENILLFKTEESLQNIFQREFRKFTVLNSWNSGFIILFVNLKMFRLCHFSNWQICCAVLCNISTAPSTLSRTLFGSLWTFVGCLFKLNPMFQDKLWFLCFFNWTKKLVCCDIINSIMKCRKRKFVCLYVHMMVVMSIIFT